MSEFGHPDPAAPEHVPLNPLERQMAEPCVGEGCANRVAAVAFNGWRKCEAHVFLFVTGHRLDRFLL